MGTRTIKTGCKYHDDCFTCPFEDCIEGIQSGNALFGKIKAQALVKQGYSQAQIAMELNKSRGTIKRYLSDNSN